MGKPQWTMDKVSVTFVHLKYFFVQFSISKYPLGSARLGRKAKVKVKGSLIILFLFCTKPSDKLTGSESEAKKETHHQRSNTLKHTFSESNSNTLKYAQTHFLWLQLKYTQIRPNKLSLNPTAGKDTKAFTTSESRLGYKLIILNP